MGFSIFQFNKKKLQKLMFGENGINLNCGDLGLLNEIVDKYNSLPKYDIDGNGKVYVWINYEMLMNDFPILSMNIGTYRNVCRKLEKLGFIEKEDRAIKLQGGDCKKKTFFRPTEMTLGIITTESDVKAELELQKGLEPVVENQVAKTPAKKKQVERTSEKIEKIEVIEGQVAVEEALEQVPSKEIDEIIKEATGANEATIEKAIEYAIYKDAEKPIGFAIKAIKEGWDMTIIENKSNVVNPLGFNNFEPREYDYDKLERNLLGWE